jgi:hypothetical protein
MDKASKLMGWCFAIPAAFDCVTGGGSQTASLTADTGAEFLPGRGRAFTEANNDDAAEEESVGVAKVGGAIMGTALVEARAEMERK